MTEEELLKEKARTEGARIAYVWLKRHILDFDQSPASSKKIQDYLEQHRLDFSEESLEKAFTELKKVGVTFTAAPAPAAPAAPASRHAAAAGGYRLVAADRAVLLFAEGVDPPGQQRDLDFRRTGVTLTGRVLRQDLFLDGGVERHVTP